MINETEVPTTSLSDKAAGAAKWSSITQIAMKLIGPITTMVLARFLTPASFGIVASATMIVSLADLISDAGFQKYLVQHQFDCENEKDLCACVAFWTNLSISIATVTAVFIFRNQLAYFVGSEGYGSAFAVASLALPLTSLVSVQTALFQRVFDFKSLFGASIGYSITNLVAAVSLALLGFDYWAVILGTLFATAFRALWLTLKSSWRPMPRYSVTQLKYMLSYSIWVLAESAATWVNTWAGTFVIGNRMSQTNVGYYKTSTTMSASIIGIVTGAMMPVVFSTLSSIQDSDRRFERVFLKMQSYLALCVIPIGAGCFVYRRTMTLLLLGGQWLGTSLFFGLWMLSSSIVIVFGYMCSEAYRARGMPKVCVIVQVAYLMPFLPALYISSGYGYETLSFVMPAIRLLLPCINLIAMKAFIGISPWKMVQNCKWYYAATAIAISPGLITTAVTDSIAAEAASILVSVFLYAILVLTIKPIRSDVVELADRMGMSNFIPSKFRAAGKDAE